MDEKRRFSTMDEYIGSFPPPVRRKLQSSRKMVRELAPEAQPVRETYPLGGWRRVPVRLR